MNQEIIFMVEEDIEGGYIANALGYSIHTQSETLEGLKNQIKDAVHCHFADAEMPSIIRIHLVKDEVITV